MKNSVIVLIVTAVMLMASTVIAGVPQMINYQGRLTDAAGDPVANESHSVKFKIYGSEAGNDSLWWSGSQAVQTTDGLFSYQLGSSVHLPEDLFSADTIRYLGITIGTDSEISPRTRIIPGAYSYQALKADLADNASNAENLGSQPPAYYLDWNNLSNIPGDIADGDDNSGGDITNVDVAGGLAGGGSSGSVTISLPSNSVNSDHIQSDAVDSDEIATDAVGSDEIAHNAVTMDDIATGAVGSAQISNGAVDELEIADDAVNYSEIATGAVRTDEIYDGTIQQADLSFTAIDESSTQTITGTKTLDDLEISTTTRRLSIHSSAFVPSDHSIPYSRRTTGGGYLSFYSISSDYRFIAPVCLPDSAWVTQFEATLYDDNPTHMWLLRLSRVDIFGNETNMGYCSTDPATPGMFTIRDNTVVNPRIDNEHYYYFVWTYVTSSVNMRLYGVEVEYTITKPLP